MTIDHSPSSEDPIRNQSCETPAPSASSGPIRTVAGSKARPPTIPASHRVSNPPPGCGMSVRRGVSVASNVSSPRITPSVIGAPPEIPDQGAKLVEGLDAHPVHRDDQVALADVGLRRGRERGTRP